MRQRLQYGFTLVEMLTTILILSVLMCLLLPGIAAVRRAALRSKAGTQILVLADAIKQYRIVYGMWPGQIQGDNDGTYDDPAEQRLIINALRSNKLHRVFIDIPEDALDASGCYRDPFGRPYAIAMDENNDGTTDVSNASCPSCASLSTAVVDTVAVIFWGAVPGDPKQRAYSWLVY